MKMLRIIFISSIIFAVFMLISYGKQQNKLPLENPISPTVISVQPNDGAMEVPINTTVTVEFSEPMIVHTSSFYLIEDKSSMLVKTKVATEESKITLTPIVSLQYNTEYIACISDKISNIAGDTFGEEYKWSFITELKPHSLEWKQAFSDLDDGTAESVQQTTDGGYILAGWIKSHGTKNVWLIKTNAVGVEQWSQTFDGSGNNRVTFTQQTVDGGYILAGTYAYAAGDDDAWLIKTDAAGVKQWSQTFGGSDKDYAYSVQQTTDRGYILAGKTWSYGAGNYDAWLIKTNAAGVKQWSRTFGDSGYDDTRFVQQTTDGGYILTGRTTSFGAGNYDAWLIKTNAAGVKQWSQAFGGSKNDYAESIQQTTDGGYILVGGTVSFGTSSRDPFLRTRTDSKDAWLIKTDAVGVKQWSRTFGGSYNDGVESVQQTTDGGYILAGWTKSEYNWADAWLIKTDAVGVEQWKYRFGSMSGWAESVQQTTDGGYILAGWSKSYGHYDAWLIKVSH